MSKDRNLRNYTLNLFKKPPAFYPWLRQVMGTLAGVFLLSQMLDWCWYGKGRRNKKQEHLRVVWFTDAQIMAETSLTKRELELAKKQLKELPFLKIRAVGDPRKTEYVLNLNRWCEFVDSTKWVHTGSDSTFGGVGSKSTDRGVVHTLTRARPLPLRGVGAKPTTPPEKKDKPEHHPRWKHYAQKLVAAITEVRKLNKNSNTRNWGYSFYMLHKGTGVPIPRIKTVLDWYCQELKEGGDLIRSNPKFLSIAYTAQRFREKFFDLEGQMNRHKGPEDVMGTKKTKKKVLTLSKKERKALRQKRGW